MNGMGVDKTWKMNLTDAKGDPGKLVSQIQDAGTAKVDAIIVLFATLTAAHAALDSVKSSGIPFFSIDSGWQDPAIADLTRNNYILGGAPSHRSFICGINSAYETGRRFQSRYASEIERQSGAGYS
ncbi:substrate-binding domain-containing protein [Rhizobium sp. L43]|uniref:substrate-binding domain-containing protein n=1 Tax=Rhizobium sp. L43 TaxID=2035452 RepID=UPI00117A255D|nr:substrate-binding domain-containing protein [Rhizobium sp. L43]